MTKGTEMLSNLADLRKGLKHIMTLERMGSFDEAATYYEETFRPSLKLVGDKIGKTADEVRALLQATPNRRHRVDFQ
jgi:hypothetical protein